MSTGNTKADLSYSNFAAIFEAALGNYKSLTGQDLGTHPFAVALESYTSPASVLAVFRKQVKTFGRFRKGEGKLIAYLSSIVNMLFTLPATLGEGIDLPCSPAKTILAGIGILLGAVRDVIASFENLLNLFERIHFFLQRLNYHTTTQLSPEMTVSLGKIMAQVLSAVALSTKEMKDGRIKTFLKKLMGKTVMEDSLRRLDALTNEGNLLVAARTPSEVKDSVDDSVTTSKEVIQSVDGNVKATKEPTHHMDQSVMAVKEVISEIDGDVKPTKEPAHDLDQSRTATRIKEATHDVGVDLLEATEISTHRANDNDNVKAIKGFRELGCNLLVGGYISCCFAPQHAERYFSYLLKSDNIPAYPELSASVSPGFEGTSFFASSAPGHISLQFPGQSRWVLDRGIVNRGTVVPQKLWAPHTHTDRINHVEEAELQLPIFFQCSDGTLGLPLEAAASGRCHELVGAESFAPLGLKPTTHIRIVWPGYVEFKRQVQIRDETSQRNPINIFRFAHHVGRSVEAFIKSCKPDAGRPNPQWRIGEDGIQPSEIVIIGAVHVSAGSWMPILQLNRWIF